MSGSKHFTDNQFTIKEVIQNFSEWIAYFISQWKILILAGLLGIGLGALVSIFKKPVFIATTSFVLEDGDSGGMGQMSGLASLVGVNLGSMGGTSGLFQGDNIMELYRSDRMLDEALLSPFDENQLLIDRFIAFEEINTSGLCFFTKSGS